jgi:lysophospholipase L1-like esterase
MARPGTRTAICGTCAGIVLTALCAAAFAQQVQEPTLAPYSRECQTNEPFIDTALPNVTAALQKRKAIKILAIGASASAGLGAAQGGYTAIIRQILQRAVKGIDVVIINRGVSGELAVNAAHRIRTEVALEEPDLVLWQVGTNDALAYVPVESIESSVVGTIHWLRQHKVDVILVGLQRITEMQRDQHYISVRDNLRKIAAKENVVIIRRTEALKLIQQATSDGLGYLPDEFAQTEAGYSCLAQYVARAIAVGVFGKRMRAPAPSPAPQAPPQSQ